MIDSILIILLCLLLAGFILANYCRFLKHSIKNSKAVNDEFVEEEIYSAVETLLQQLKELEDKND